MIYNQTASWWAENLLRISFNFTENKISENTWLAKVFCLFAFNLYPDTEHVLFQIPRKKQNLHKDFSNDY